MNRKGFRFSDEDVAPASVVDLDEVTDLRAQLADAEAVADERGKALEYTRPALRAPQ